MQQPLDQQGLLTERPYLGTTVLGTTFLGFIGRNRFGQAEGTRFNALAVDTLADQVLLDRVGTPLRRAHVVPGTANRVGVTINLNLETSVAT